MKNFLLAFALTAIATFAIQLFLPWWSLVIIAFVVAYFIQQAPLPAFMAGFLSVFILWVVYAYMLSSANNNLLLDKVNTLLNPITMGHAVVLYLLTGTIGGLVSGFAALSGNMIRRVNL